MDISLVEGVFEINCVCHGETENAPYEVSISATVELDDLDEYVNKCLLLFTGLMELADNENNSGWVPSNAAEFLVSLVEAAEMGAEFDMLG